MAKKSNFKLHSNVPQVIDKIESVKKDRIEEATHHLRNEIVETLSGERTGETYKVPGTESTYYTASAPGEPPASRLGHLRSSIAWEVVHSEGDIKGRVGTDKEYGAKLETGEYPASNKPNSAVARPWMRPTFRRERAALRRIIGGGRWF